MRDKKMLSTIRSRFNESIWCLRSTFQGFMFISKVRLLLAPLMMDAYILLFFGFQVNIGQKFAYNCVCSMLVSYYDECRNYACEHLPSFGTKSTPSHRHSLDLALSVITNAFTLDRRKYESPVILTNCNQFEHNVQNMKGSPFAPPKSFIRIRY
jgi:hypothetical protein